MYGFWTGLRQILSLYQNMKNNRIRELTGFR